MRALLGFFFVSSLAVAGLPLDRWADDFVFDHQEFSGDWSSAQRWPGRLCDGSSSYRGRIGGKISDVRFQFRDGYIEAVAELKDVLGSVSGAYRSAYSACSTVAGRLGLSSDFANIKLRVFLNSSESEAPVRRIEVEHTQMGRLHFGLWLPDYFERYMTVLVNRALSTVWSSRV